MNAIYQSEAGLRKSIEFIVTTEPEGNWLLAFRRVPAKPDSIEIGMHWQNKPEPTHWASLTRQEWERIGRELFANT